MGSGISCGLQGVKLPMPGRGGASKDNNFLDTGAINKLDQEQQGGGKTNATMITGQKRPTGEETYVEIKAPTTVGNRSSVPYTQVLPSYKKKAESALDRKSIPKEHQKRVKEYFESLNK